MRIVVVLPPAKTSHEIETLRAMPNSELLIIADHKHHPYATHPVNSWRLPWLGSPRRWTAALAWLRGLRTIDLHVEGHPPDLLISFELFSVTTRQAARLARTWNIPHVAYVAEVLDSNPLYKLPPWRGNARRSVRQLDGVICLNQTGARHATAQGMSSERIVTVSPGVDTGVFRPREDNLKDRPLVAISVGELRDDKGVLDVIASADVAMPRLPSGFRLVLVGDGPLKATVDRLADSRPWLNVLGRIPREEVANQLRAAGVFVLTPHSRPFWVEQFGFAVVEAMACGLPVVVTSCGALREVVPDHNPVVPEGDFNAIANGLVAALGLEGNDWGRQNLLVAKERYSLITQGERLEAALTEMLKSHTVVAKKNQGSY